MADYTSKTHLEEGRKITYGGRTTLEKILIAVSVLACIAVVALVVTLAIVVPKEDISVHSPSSLSISSDDGPATVVEGEDICTTVDCVTAAAKIHSAIDYSVDPCDDFFEFACGTWHRKNIIPDDSSSVTTFGRLSEEVQDLMKGILEEENENDLEAIVKLKSFYASCTDDASLNSRNVSSLLGDVMTSLGGWPAVDSTWNESAADPLMTFAAARKMGMTPIIRFYVGADAKDSKSNIITIDQPRFGMPGRLYFLLGREHDVLVAYENWAVSFAMLYGADEITAKQDMKDMVDFEVQMANNEIQSGTIFFTTKRLFPKLMTTASEHRRDNEALYNKMTIDELQASYPEIDWLSYISNVMSSVGITVDLTEPVIVRDPDYFEKLATLLNATSPRVIANYVAWRMVTDTYIAMPQSARDLQSDYNKLVFGITTAPSRWKTCISHMLDHMSSATGRVFVDSEFDEESRNTAKDMIKDVRGAFSELLSELDWMDDETRTLANNKAEAIAEHIGFPDYIADDTKLNAEYFELNFVKTEHFNNVMKSLKYWSEFGLRRIREAVDKERWFISPAIVNAFYNPSANTITFPAGILQPPFYSKGYSRSMNYGAIGVVIGHEITHGFDDQGRQFDKDGNVHQWWTDEVIDNFKEKAQCIIDQYSGYLVTEVNMTINGINTQGENIADNGGAKQAFRAYQNWVKKEGKEKRLPGLDFSHEQLFFLNFAQVWCGKRRPEALRNGLLTGVHSPGNFRVIGTAHNSKEFAEAFKCPVGSNMNPEKKCSVW